MKNRASFQILFVALAFLFSNCANKDRQSQKEQLYKIESKYKKIDFKSFIEDSGNEPRDIYNELLLNKQFTNVLEHGHYYFSDVLSLLNSGSATPMQIAVCVCAMQNLNVHDYVKLCNTILSLYNGKKIAFGTLEHAISPDFWRKRIIIDNYQNPEVIALIKKMQGDKTITDLNFLNWLPDILSGKSSNRLKEFDEANG